MQFFPSSIACTFMSFFFFLQAMQKTPTTCYSSHPMTDFVSVLNIAYRYNRNHPSNFFSPCSDIVGFSSLSASLKPHDVITVLDHLHALIDENFNDPDILVTERTAEKGVIVTGLDEHLVEETTTTNHYDSKSVSSVTDSSYGSDVDLLDENVKRNLQSQNHRKPSHYASKMALAALHLMSASSKVHVPLRGRRQLQLRIALHSGPCSAGILGLQVTSESHRIPEFKLFGPTLHRAEMLCRTGLALQIRVSQECKALLNHCDELLFERCPDYSADGGGDSIGWGTLSSYRP